MHSVTLLIPTHNRPTFLKRLLDNLAVQNPQFSIIVADSSHWQEAYGKNQSVVAQHRSTVDINHTNCQGEEFWAKYIKLLKTIK
jgi:GT2 family glycosyltransferase